uniref:Brix domain-containing protein n=1 Tax=Macrostomum lignano TaxID=282301 RepID=A0A1I8H9T0_9PLAT
MATASGLSTRCAVSLSGPCSATDRSSARACAQLARHKLRTVAGALSGSGGEVSSNTSFCTHGSSRCKSNVSRLAAAVDGGIEELPPPVAMSPLADWKPGRLHNIKWINLHLNVADCLHRRRATCLATVRYIRFQLAPQQHPRLAVNQRLHGTGSLPHVQLDGLGQAVLLLCLVFQPDNAFAIAPLLLGVGFVEFASLALVGAFSARFLSGRLSCECLEGGHLAGVDQLANNSSDAVFVGIVGEQHRLQHFVHVAVELQALDSTWNFAVAFAFSSTRFVSGNAVMALTMMAMSDSNTMMALTTVECQEDHPARQLKSMVIKRTSTEAEGTQSAKRPALGSQPLVPHDSKAQAQLLSDQANRPVPCTQAKPVLCLLVQQFDLELRIAAWRQAVHLICMARKNKKGRAKRRNKAQPGREEEEKAKPHTMIFSRAGVGKFVKQLATDLRLAFEPYTAMRLRFSKSNVLKDAVAIAGKFAVSHLVYFTHPSDSINMRIVACPHGPTLTFRVLSYCLRADVLSAARRINSSASIYQHPPLLIMNGFTGEGRQLRLLTTTFRSLLPSLNLQQLNLRTVRRCLLLNYDPETDQIQLRHYSVRLAPRGVSKAVRRLRRKKVPDLSRYTDFNDFVNGAGCASDSGLSDADFDGDHNTIDCLPVGVGPANPQGGASAVRLTELGPRIELQLLKVEEGVNSGAVLYHKFVMKTPEQLVELDSRARRKRRLKAKRRSDQVREMLCFLLRKF